MTSIEWLKAGLVTNKKGELVMSRRMVQQGWLNKMLVDSGVIIAGEKAKKERCYSDFQSQLLYIDGMKAVLGDTYDPRHAARAFGKDGKYKPTNKWKNEANPDGRSKSNLTFNVFLLSKKLCFFVFVRPFNEFLNYPVFASCAWCRADDISTNAKTWHREPSKASPTQQREKIDH